MQTQVKLCENSKENKITKDVLQEADFSVDDVLEKKVSNGMFMPAETFWHRSLEERAAEYDGQLHLDGEFDWGEPIGRERW